MTIYVPGTEELDQKKQNISLQQLGAAVTALQVQARRKLTAATTFYVDGSLGNDSNTGSSAGTGAFLTIQAAINYIRDNIDAANQQIVVQVADGTYTASVRLFPVLGSYQSGSHNEAILRGNVASLGNVLLNTTNANCINACNCWFPWMVEGFEFRTTTSGSHIVLEFDSKIYIGANKFGAAAGGPQIAINYRSIVEFVDNYSISGGATFHKYTAGQSQMLGTGVTVTVTGTPAFSSAFALAVDMSFIVENGAVYSGSATGTRYSASLNSVIDTGGGGANYYPGNAAGSTATGGQYA